MSKGICVADGRGDAPVSDPAHSCMAMQLGEPSGLGEQLLACRCFAWGQAGLQHGGLRLPGGINLL